MTEPLAGTPTWQSVEWAKHARTSAETWCVTCSEYLVPREGAVCPVRSSTASFEGTA